MDFCPKLVHKPLMSAQCGFLSEAGSHKPFDEPSAWIFCPKLVRTSHLLSHLRGFLSEAG